MCLISRKGQCAIVGWETAVDVLDQDSFKPVRQFGANRKFIGVAATTDGLFMALLREQQERSDLEYPEQFVDHRFRTGNPQPRVSFSPTLPIVATGGYGTAAKLWKSANGKLIHELDVGPNPVDSTSKSAEMVGLWPSSTLTPTLGIRTLKRAIASKTYPKMSGRELKFGPDAAEPGCRAGD